MSGVSTTGESLLTLDSIETGVRDTPPKLAIYGVPGGNRRLKPTCFSKPTWATISACHKDAETERSQVPTK